jgi:hypothetical protein
MLQREARRLGLLRNDDINIVIFTHSLVDGSAESGNDILIGSGSIGIGSCFGDICHVR